MCAHQCLQTGSCCQPPLSQHLACGAEHTKGTWCPHPQAAEGIQSLIILQSKQAALTLDSQLLHLKVHCEHFSFPTFVFFR